MVVPVRVALAVIIEVAVVDVSVVVLFDHSFSRPIVRFPFD